MTPQQLLLAIADWYEARPSRWIQGKFWVPQSGPISHTIPEQQACLSGAFACFDAPDAIQIAVDTVHILISPATSITKWNDKPGRTVQEVITLLREAACSI